MTEPISDVEFLAGSASRFQVLRALVDGATSLAELESVADVSRTTLWRTLTELERRGWVDRVPEGYEATPVGAFVAETFADMLVGLGVADELGDLIRWLPSEEIDFSLSRLADAEVAVPTPSDPQAPMRLAEEQTAGAQRVRLLTHATSPAVIAALHDGMSASKQELEAVMTRGAIDAILANPEMRAQFRDLLKSDAATIYRYDGMIPHILAIFDDERVGLGVDDDHGRPQGVLGITDDVVLAWAEEIFEDYRGRADRLAQKRFIE